MDCKASIKIEFSVFNEKTYTTDMWINYFPDHDGVDERVKEFFRNAYEESHEKYEEKCRKIDAERDRLRTENYERQLLRDLKLKYDTK